MRNLNTLMVFAVVSIAAFLAAVIYRPNTVAHAPVSAGALLPGLTERLTKVHAITILHAGENVTLQRQHEAWTVADKANYPAMERSIRELLLGLAYMQRIEPKTRNPKYYSNLGLADADKSGGEASRIELKDQSGHSIAKVTIGKRRPATEANKHSDVYALVQDDPQTWLAEGDMPAIGAAGAWLKRTLLELERSRIAEVILTHSDGETLHLLLKEPGKPGMTLEGLKPDEMLQSDYALDDIADRFTGMQLEDVRPLDKIKWPDKPDLQVEVRTKDGLVVQVTAAKIDGQSWIRLAASAAPGKAEPSMTTAKTQATAASTPESKHASSSHEAPAPQQSAKNAKDEAANKQSKSPPQEAAELQALWHGWAYTLADWAYQTLNKRRADLVKPMVKPAPSSPTSAVTPSEQDKHAGVAPDTEPASLLASPTPKDEAVSESPDDLLDEDVAAPATSSTATATTAAATAATTAAAPAMSPKTAVSTTSTTSATPAVSVVPAKPTEVPATQVQNPQKPPFVPPVSVATPKPATP